jgi:peptidoglycan/xylan/chitin deacetylase (PgdA/CDA1 family)
MIAVRPRGVTLPVLLYHRVGPPVPGAFPALTVSPERFRSHVLWLHRSGYRTVRPCEWLAWAQGSGAIPRRAVMITFDDGYADLDRHAFPVLRERGFSAVVFTVTRRLGQTNAWDAGYGSAGLALLSAEQIRRWASDGIDFGAHTRTHVDLADAAAPLRDEVDGSADDLRGLLGAGAVPFAYPWGRTSPAAEARVREAFPLAFTTREGLNTRATDLHRLRRTMVQPDDGLLALRLRVTFGRDPLRAVRKRLRVRSRVLALLRATG